MNPVIAFACYRPKPGKEYLLLQTLHRYAAALKSKGWVTTYPWTTLRTDDGYVLTIFEWTSGALMNRAFEDPSVQSYWKDIHAVADLAPVGAIGELQKTFAHFVKPEARPAERVA